MKSKENLERLVCVLSEAKRKIFGNDDSKKNIDSLKGIANQHLFYQGIDLTDIYNDLNKAELFDKIRELFSKVTYAPFATNNDGKVEYVPTVKIAEEFDKEIFRQVLEQCGFEIKEKENE